MDIHETFRKENLKKLPKKINKQKNKRANKNSINYKNKQRVILSGPNPFFRMIFHKQFTYF